MRRVTLDELRALLDADAVTLVEALPATAYDAEHIPGAVNVPDELSEDMAETIAPDRTRTVVVYCSGPSCSRSKVTAAAFVRLGYTDVRVYPGGKAEWIQAGLSFAGHRAFQAV
jgi:rhodanese-related sulfurtransferase